MFDRSAHLTRPGHLQEIAKAFEIRAMPTFVAVKGGKEIGRVTGASPPKLKVRSSCNIP